MTEAENVLYKRKCDLKREIEIRTGNKRRLEKELKTLETAIQYREKLLKDVENAYKLLSLIEEGK